MNQHPQLEKIQAWNNFKDPVQSNLKPYKV